MGLKKSQEKKNVEQVKSQRTSVGGGGIRKLLRQTCFRLRERNHKRRVQSLELGQKGFGEHRRGKAQRGVGKHESNDRPGKSWNESD